MLQLDSAGTQGRSRGCGVVYDKSVEMLTVPNYMFVHLRLSFGFDLANRRKKAIFAHVYVQQNFFNSGDDTSF